MVCVFDNCIYCTFSRVGGVNEYLRLMLFLELCILWPIQTQIGENSLKRHSSAGF